MPFKTRYRIPLLLLLAGAVLLPACGGGGGGGGGDSAPTSPANLTAHAASTTRIDLAWTDRASNESSYRIERSTSPTFNPVVTVARPSNTSAYSDTGLAPSTIYYYRACAVGSGGSSCSSMTYASTFSVSTLVSSGTGSTSSQAGTADAAPGTAARFNYPYGVATTATGTVLYVADTMNHTIRRVAMADGATVTLAGKALTAGSADDTGAAARFSQPTGIAVSADGSMLYIADTLNHTIRTVDPANNAVATLAGTAGSRGADNGTGAAASFNQPESVAVSPDGSTLYVADTLNHTIRMITISDKTVTTFAGTALLSGSADGTGSAARFSEPAGVACSPDGTKLFVADRMNHTIRQIIVSGGVGTGSVTTLAGAVGDPGSADGSFATARFREPSGLTMSADGNTLYVADSDNHTIRKLDLAGATVTTLAGTAGFIGSTNIAAYERFNHPVGIAFHPSGAGLLFVADTFNHAIRVVDILTSSVDTLAGYVSPETASALSSPDGLATTESGSMLYVADSGRHAIFQVEISSGTMTTLAGSSAGFLDGVGSAAAFYQPYGVATDGSSLFVADTYLGLIRHIEISTATVSTLAGTPCLTANNPGDCWTDGFGAAARFYKPVGITTASTGTYSNYVFITDALNNVIRRVDKTTAEVVTIAGAPGMPPSCTIACTGDGVGTSARFNMPWGIAISGRYLYVSEYRNHSIRRIDLEDSYRVTTIAGKQGSSGYADGSGANARFDWPQGLAVKGTGLFIVDHNNEVIRKIDLNTGIVSTVAGMANIKGNTNDGTGVNARFNDPAGLATDGTSIFVGDTTNRMIRVIN